MLIRQAKLNDLEGITACGRRFFEYAKYAEQGMPFDEISFRNCVINYIINPNGIVLLLVDEDDFVRGGIAGMVMPWCFNKNIKVMMELFFWVDYEHRGLNGIRLYKEFEKAVKAKGAQFSYMMSVSTDLQEGVNKLYLRNGYIPQEQFFIKRLEQ